MKKVSIGTNGLRKYTKTTLIRQKRRQVSKGKENCKLKKGILRSNTKKITHVTRQWNSDSHVTAQQTEIVRK